MFKNLLILILMTITLHNYIYANAVVANNIIVDIPNQEITFDLEWKNSWRMDSMSAPKNWDAVWVFVKFSECDSFSTNLSPDWEHGKIDSIISNNSFGDLEPVLNNGSIGMADSLGVMLRRKTNGFFHNQAATSITLKINNLNPILAYHIKVFAIEMVYVPKDTFDIGGNIDLSSFDSTQINSENAITITSLATGANSSINLSANFPKGYEGFHCMKYEISQGQYAGFLNAINATQSSNRFTATTNYRYRITNTGIQQFDIYISSRENRAGNYIGWNDLLSYLDWAALRPMTELQYEKACRGPQQIVVDEFAWGTTYINNGNQITGAENGTEYFVDTTANCVYNNTVFTGGDAGTGPVRCGIFALPSNSTREQSGATYYGIMEMTGNIWEACVNVSTFTETTTGTFAFDGTTGDGYLDINGLFNVANWPTANNGSGIRGGAWNDNIQTIKLASRNSFLWNGNSGYNVGGRGIR